MADGINRQRGTEETWKVMRDAKDMPQDGESSLVKATRKVMAGHGRHSPGGFANFTGMDEARLARAVSRAPRDGVDTSGLEGMLKADVSIQRMAERRERDPGAPGNHTKFDERDIDAVGVRRSYVLSRMPAVDAQWMKAGRFEMASPAIRGVAAEALSEAGRYQVRADPDIGVTLPGRRVGGLAAQAASMREQGHGGAMPKGREEMPMPQVGMGVRKGGYGR